MHMFVTGEVVELLDAGLHVVAGDAFALHDRCHIDPVFHTFVGGNRLGGNPQAEFILCLHHRNPELAFQENPPFRRPYRLHALGGISFR